MQETQNPTVTVYVRLGADSDQRVISFSIPDGLDGLELLDYGFALDGNQAAGVIALEGDCPDCIYRGPFDSWGGTLMNVLAEVQSDLVKYLRSSGFEPRFA